VHGVITLAQLHEEDHRERILAVRNGQTDEDDVVDLPVP
jgi:hypothetical protein